MSNKQTPRHRSNGAAVDLSQAADAIVGRARATKDFTDALSRAREIDPTAAAKRLPSGHVILAGFPDGAPVCFDPKAVVHIEAVEPDAGIVDLSKLGDAPVEVCQVNYQFGLHIVIGSVETVAGLLFGTE